MAPSVSVVIAAYNAEPWLGEALESVARQTVPPDEVIVVDDGSKDGTASVAERHGARVIRTTNGGAARARNLAMDAARGAWLAVLDADDLWAPDRLERQLGAAALAPDVQFVACDHYQFVDDGRVTMPSLLAARRDRYARIDRRQLAPGVARLSRMGVGLVTLGMAFFPSTWLMRRELALAIGGFDGTLPPSEDYEFLLRMFVHTDVLMLEQPLVGYRLHPGGVSRDDRKMARAHLRIGQRMEARPGDYAPGALAAYRPLLRARLMEAAATSIKLNDRDDARSMLRAAGAIMRDPSWLALSLASYLPPPAIAVLHRLKRRFEDHQRP